MGYVSQSMAATAVNYAAGVRCCIGRIRQNETPIGQTDAGDRMDV